MEERSHYRPTRCEKCGSEDITIRVIWEKGIVRALCNECLWSKSLPKEENLSRRNNTTQAHWAQRIKSFHPSCAVCGSNKDLEAHHIIPVANSEKYRYYDSNGVTLCKECHYLAHHKERE